MALKYTGRASSITVGDKVYVPEETYRKNPKAYTGSYASPIQGLSKEAALKMVERSSLHSFEDVKGNDLLEAETTPPVPMTPQVVKDK
jgi:hypothetical protein